MEYLTEGRLKKLAKAVFNKQEIIFNRRLTKDFIPDIFIPDKKLIIEFDGPRHFTKAKTVLRDLKIDEYSEEKNINIVHVPSLKLRILIFLL